MTKPLSIFIAIVLVSSCRKSGKDWVVLPEKEALELKQPCSRPFPEGLSGYWELGNKEIQRAELRFQGAMIEALKCVSKEESEAAPGVYYAQYAGFFRNGHKVVYVNAVGDSVPGWRDHAIKLCDGGVMSFGAVLDLDSDAVDSFEFNGKFAGRVQMRNGCFEGAAQHGVAPDGRSPAAPARR
jgi:hypothetical protein